MGNQIPLGSLVFTGGRDLRPDLGLLRCKALSGSGEPATRQTPVCHGARSPAARHPFGGQRAARRASWVHLRVGTGAPCGSRGMGGLEAHGAVRALRCRAMCQGAWRGVARVPGSQRVRCGSRYRRGRSFFGKTGADGGFEEASTSRQRDGQAGSPEGSTQRGSPCGAQPRSCGGCWRSTSVGHTQSTEDTLQIRETQESLGWCGPATEHGHNGLPDGSKPRSRSPPGGNDRGACPRGDATAAVGGGERSGGSGTEGMGSKRCRHARPKPATR
jgi:hypothetical protein